ncbi:TetR family transcriptional regulator [Paenibacillus sp. DMB20]|nr:TetR family transcriptional regulator [Paenibacillus sp. DMB20]
MLEAALKLFSLKGFHATTTKEIAAESGVAEGLIFYYFGDKRTLLLHLIQNFSFAVAIQNDIEHLTLQSLEERLVRYGLKYHRFLKQNADYIKLVWSPEMIQDEAVSTEVFQFIGKIGSLGSTLLKRDAGNTNTEPLDESISQVAVMTLTSSILVYFMIHSRFGEHALGLDEESYIRQLVRLLLHGLNGVSLEN